MENDLITQSHGWRSEQECGEIDGVELISGSSEHRPWRCSVETSCLLLEAAGAKLTDLWFRSWFKGSENYPGQDLTVAGHLDHPPHSSHSDDSGLISETRTVVFVSFIQKDCDLEPSKNSTTAWYRALMGYVISTAPHWDPERHRHVFMTWLDRCHVQKRAESPEVEHMPLMLLTGQSSHRLCCSPGFFQSLALGVCCVSVGRTMGWRCSESKGSGKFHQTFSWTHLTGREPSD